MIVWSRYKYFKEREFDSPDAPGSGVIIDEELVKKLNLMRLFYKSPIHINSGVRTEQQNKKVRGSKNSAHVKGFAVDIPVHDSHARYKMITLAHIVGFRRIGVYDKHVHLDNDPTKPQEVIWHGKRKN